MKGKENEACLSNQDKIWEYFQNESLESFSEAKPRLDFMIRQIARRRVVPAPRVLNIGVGSGYFEETIQRHGWEAHSLDPNEKAIKRLVEKGIQGHRGYVEQMPFEESTFDFVVASEVLEHLSDDQRRKGIEEITRILKKGGWLIGTVPYCEDLSVNRVICPNCEAVFHRWGHQKSFDMRTLSDELSRCLKVVEVRRTAFVAFRERPLFGKMKSLIKLILAKCGQMIATPSIYFCAGNLETRNKFIDFS